MDKKFRELSTEEILELVKNYLEGKTILYKLSNETWRIHDDEYKKLCFYPEVYYKVQIIKPKIDWRPIHKRYKYLFQTNKIGYISDKEPLYCENFKAYVVICGDVLPASIFTSFELGECSNKDSLVIREDI